MNKKDFKRFLAFNLKKCKNGRFNNIAYNFDAFYSEAKDRMFQGFSSYELSRFETSTGNPVEYRF